MIGQVNENPREIITYWYLMWESAVCQSSQLIEEVACRDFTLQGFDAKAIKDREGEDSFRSVYGSRKKVHLQELNMKWLGIWTLTDPDSVMAYAQGINDAEDSFLVRVIAVWARLAIVTHVDDKAKGHEVDGLKKLAIPFGKVMEWGVMMGLCNAAMTEFGTAKAVQTLIEAITSVT